MNRPFVRPDFASRHASLAWLALGFMLGFLLLPTAWAQESKPEEVRSQPRGQVAPVSIDGETLMYLRGVTSYPAEKRAAELREKIIALAQDDTFSVEGLSVVAQQDRSEIVARDEVILRIFDADAALENIDRAILGEVYLLKIRQAIEDFRKVRSGPVLLQGSLYALGATVVMLLLLWSTQRLFRWLVKWSEENVQQGVEELASKSHHLIQAGPIWTVIASLLRLLRTVIYLLIAYFFLNTVLGLFPWTRPVAKVLFKLILDPLAIRAFFRSIERGRITFEGFDPDWATPTYKLVRLGVIAFGLVIAYPYIPGSDSMAFKGVSVFAGVLLSLGSSSFIANSIAGLSMTYRAAFREGDRIKVGDVVGTVDDIKLMVTRVRTPKNEHVIIPNSNILNDNVTNYSHMARQGGVILHTVVGIGYDTPWRQVEAMLLLAADRTAGLKKDPPPFVLQQSLGDFAVNYELNAYSEQEHRMPAMYSELHAHIQDVFNEHGVQIMSPAYEADPTEQKIVPPEKWYEAPAKKPA